MTPIADLRDRLLRLAHRREADGIYTDAELVRAAERALAERAGGVKALVWHGPFKPGENGSHYHHIYADSALGRYTFDWKGWKKFDPPTSTDCPGDFFYTARDLDDAKAAAQADYERRILSALTTEPAAPEGRQEAVAWQWRQRAVYKNSGRKGEWSDWSQGRAPFLRVANYEAQERPLFTHPAEQAVTEAWQPIATADKDARQLLLGVVRKGKLEEVYLGGFRYAVNDDEVSCWWGDCVDDEICPTHWLPVPPLTAALAQKEEGR